ncbi:MAG: DUF6438 domain-containing protein [Sphingomonadales bacterium]
MTTRALLAAFALLLMTGNAQAQQPRPEAGDFFGIIYGVCLEECPVFRIYLFSDDTLVYEGQSHVAKMGRHKIKAPEGSFQAVVHQLQTIGFSDYERNYSPGNEVNCGDYTTDQPSVTLQLRHERVNMTLYLNTGCQGFEGDYELYAAIAGIEDIPDVYNWINE